MISTCQPRMNVDRQARAPVVKVTIPRGHTSMRTTSKFHQAATHDLCTKVHTWINNMPPYATPCTVHADGQYTKGLIYWRSVLQLQQICASRTASLILCTAAELDDARTVNVSMKTWKEAAFGLDFKRVSGRRGKLVLRACHDASVEGGLWSREARAGSTAPYSDSHMRTRTLDRVVRSPPVNAPTPRSWFIVLSRRVRSHRP